MTTARRIFCAACFAMVPLALLAGCTKDDDGSGTTPTKTARSGQAPTPARTDRPYYTGTPRMQQGMRDLFARVPSATPREWAEIAARLVAYGEPAVPQMVENLRSPDEDVQVMCAYALGLIQDPRSLGALHAATLAGGGKLRYEAATAMLRMGDRRGLVPMVAALESSDPLVRARAILVLHERTGETLDYRADDRPVDREAAVARWRAWLARTGGSLLPDGGQGR